MYIYVRIYVQSLVRVTEYSSLITTPPHQAFDGNFLSEHTYAWKALVERSKVGHQSGPTEIVERVNC